jgi:hypothetical protein
MAYVPGLLESLSTIFIIMNPVGVRVECLNISIIFNCREDQEKV